MVEKTSVKPVAAVAPTTMAWSTPIASLLVSVKALKDSGGFGKIMEKAGLVMTDSDLLYAKVDATPLTLSPQIAGNVIEINEDALANGKKKFSDTLGSAGIIFDAKDVKFRIF